MATSSQANGLDFLHKHDIIHWDLRAHNIFIDRAGYCLIGNFERATLMSYTPRGDLTLEGRRRLDNFSPHTAPELIRNGVPLETYRFNHAVDMWALGMIVCELQVGKVRIGFRLLKPPMLTRSRSTGICDTRYWI
jgi:serine/threonine protein kinase